MSTVKIDMAQLGSAKSAMESLATAIDSQRRRAQSACPISLPTLGDPLGRKAQYLRDRLPEVQAIIDLGTLLATDGATSASYDASSTSVADVKQRLGVELANEARDLDETSPAEDWQRFNDIFKTYKDDQDVTASFYTDLGPQGTVRFFSDLETSMRFGAYDDATTAVYEETAKNVRAGLATASHDPAFDGETFGREIVRYAVAPLLDSDEVDGDYPTGMNGASVLAFLMDEVDYGDAFLRSAVTTLDGFEQAMEDQGGASYWYGHNGHSPFNQFLSSPPQGGWAADPMAVVMKALGRNTDVGYEFLSDPARQEYYFKDRNWEADGYEGISFAAAQITTDLDLLRADAPGVTKMASSFVHLIAANDGFDPDNAKPAAEHIGSLLGFYMPSVSHALKGGGVQEGLPYSTQLQIPGLGAQLLPVFTRSDLADVVGVGMSTAEGMTNLAEGVGNLQGTRINNLAAAIQANDDPNIEVQLVSQLRGVLQESGQMQGFFQKIAGDVEIEGAVSDDAQVATFTSLVSDAIGLAPIPGSSYVGEAVGEGAKKVFDYGWGKGVELGTGQAESWLGGKTGPAVDNANANAAEALGMTEFSIFHQLSDAGLVDDPPGGMPDTWSEMQELRTTDPAAYDRYLSQAQDSIGSYVTTTDMQTAYKDPFIEYFDNPGGG